VREEGVGRGHACWFVRKEPGVLYEDSAGPAHVSTGDTRWITRMFDRVSVLVVCVHGSSGFFSDGGNGLSTFLTYENKPVVF
jgi:hypothetical protein